MGFPKSWRVVSLCSLPGWLRLRRAHIKEICECGFLFWNELQSTSETHRVAKRMVLSKDHQLGLETTEPAPYEESSGTSDFFKQEAGWEDSFTSKMGNRPQDRKYASCSEPDVGVGSEGDRGRSVVSGMQPCLVSSALPVNSCCPCDQQDTMNVICEWHCDLCLTLCHCCPWGKPVTVS